MGELPWVEVDENTYIAELPCGRAMMEPRDPEVSDGLYLVRLELPSGEVVYEGIYDFASAQELAWVMLPCLDEFDGGRSDCGRVGETLDLCQQLISRETDAIHWQRIEYIKKWMARDAGQKHTVITIPIPEYPPMSFDWIEDGSRFYVDTPYGQAVITEVREKNIIGGGIRHHAQLVHRTGAVIDCFSWIDFMEAGYAIQRRLKELLYSEVEEFFLDYVDFTLAICARLLPPGSDPIHAARLKCLEMHIHMALD